MKPITPEQASFLLQFTLPSVQAEHTTTLGVIEAIPTTKEDYRPDANSKTAVELAWHIAAAEHRFYAGIADGAFDFNAIPRPEGGLTPASVARWYTESFAKNFARLSALSGDQLAKIIDFRGVFQMPAVAFLNFSLKHSVHHRGQLSTYLRAMGGKVPSIYGESYDSAEAKKSASA